jgi:hypothetical protein
MSQQRKSPRAAPEAAGSRRLPDERTPRSTSRPVHERTTPALTREAPWFPFNATTAPVHAEGPPFGPNRFLLGANVPWVHHGIDIGTSAGRPEGGLHAHPEDAALLRQVFERFRDDGVQTARFFLLADGRAGVRFDEDGTPESLDGSVVQDIDVVLEAARSTEIQLILVLLDEGWLAPAATADGHPVGGHADTIRDPVKRAALLERVLRPVLMHCADHPAVVGWEVLAGADLHVAELAPAAPSPRGLGAALRRWLGLGEGAPESARKVSSEEMHAFLGDAVTLVRRHTRALATVGVSRWSGLPLLRGLGLDVYSVAWPADEAELRRAVSDLRLDRPVLLSSFPGNHPDRSIKTMLDTARCAGYGGAFVWSVLRHDSASGYDGQVAQWARNHGGQLFRRDASPGIPPAPSEVRESGEETASPAPPPLALRR